MDIPTTLWKERVQLPEGSVGLYEDKNHLIALAPSKPVNSPLSHRPATGDSRIQWELIFYEIIVDGYTKQPRAMMIGSHPLHETSAAAIYRGLGQALSFGGIHAIASSIVQPH